jgi:hypothetical protein
MSLYCNLYLIFGISNKHNKIFMESQTRAPVEIVQELIAIHTTRREASGKLKEKGIPEDVSAKLTATGQQIYFSAASSKSACRE